jgi:uncharacterized protein
MLTSNPDFSYYLQFNNKMVRALAWILKSPGLLSMPLGSSSQLVSSQLISNNWAEGLSDEWLLELDKQPDALLEWVNKKPSYRLGIRFERLLLFLFQKLQQQNLIENLNYNIPVYDESHRTLGELDIVYFDRQKQQRFHWENTVKFYLFRPEEYTFERWVGPNGSDWLQRKLEHLFLRQLGITNSPEGKMTLSACFSKEQNETLLNRMALIKGYLFKPLETKCNFNHEESDLINSLCESGWWAYSNQFHLADPEQKGRWRVIDKLDWIVPQFYPYQDDEMLKPNEMSLKIKYHFSQSKRSLMLAHFHLDEVTQTWVEKDRGILVDKLWPSYKKV